jgi:hypothetical protein
VKGKGRKSKNGKQNGKRKGKGRNEDKRVQPWIGKYCCGKEKDNIFRGGRVKPCFQIK